MRFLEVWMQVMWLTARFWAWVATYKVTKLSNELLVVSCLSFKRPTISTISLTCQMKVYWVIYNYIILYMAIFTMVIYNLYWTIAIYIYYAIAILKPWFLPWKMGEKKWGNHRIPWASARPCWSWQRFGSSSQTTCGTKRGQYSRRWKERDRYIRIYLYYDIYI